MVFEFVINALYLKLKPVKNIKNNGQIIRCYKRVSLAMINN